MISVNDLLKDSTLKPLLMREAPEDMWGNIGTEVNPNASFVASLYTSVLNRAPTPQELTSGINYIASNLPRDEVGNISSDVNANATEKNNLLQNIFKQGQNDPNSNAYGAKSISFGGLFTGNNDTEGNWIADGNLLFKNKDGSQVGVDSITGKAISAIAPFSTYTGNGTSTSNATNYNWHGQNVSVPDIGGGFGKTRYQSDPNGNIYLNANGDPVISKQNLSSMGGFGDWMIENGWMLPIAMVTAGAGAYALAGEAAAGGLAAGEVAGEAGAGGGLTAGTAGEVGAGDVFAGLSANAPVDTAASQAAAASLAGSGAGATDIGLGTNAALQGPTYGELGVTGVPEGGAGPTYAEMGNTGLNTQEAVAAADAASQKAALVDALKTANQVRQVASTANTLSKLLTQGGSTGAGAAGTALAGAAQNLATGQTGVGMAIPALLRGNQNPFLQSAQQPIRSSSPDLAALANLLKQG